MTATYDDYTGNNSNKNFTYNFPALLSTDIKVSVDGVTQTSGYTVNTANTRVEFTTAPAQDAKVRVYRDTAVGKTSGDEDPKAVFAAGSSVRAADLNNNFEQLLFAAHERQEQLILAEDIDTGAVTSAKILDGTIVDADINASAQIAVNKLADGSARQVLQTASNGSDVEWTNNVDIPGTLDVTSSAVFDSNITVGSGASISGNTTVGGTLGVTGTTTAAAINASGAVGVDGNFDVNTNKFTVASSTGNTTVAGTLGVTGLSTLASVDINGGAVDGTTIGASSAAAGSFTTINASGTITGNITGEVTGNAATATDLAASAKVTNSEQVSHSVNDTTYFTTSASDARYYNIGTTEEIVSGETWVGDDAKVATTKAIDNRIVDILDDVGGFIPLTDEGEIPQYHPEKENVTTSDRVGTILSIGTLTTTYTPSGGTCTIQASDLTNHSVNATITDCGSTVLSAGFGVLVETKAQTDAQYAAGPSFKFHRLVPKATEVTTVAGKATEITTCHTNITNINAVAADISDITAVAADATDIGVVAGKATEIGRLGTADAVADMNTLGTAAIVEDMNLLGTTACVADMALLGDSAVIADMATIADTSNLISNIGTVAGIQANVTTVAGNSANVTTVATNMGTVNDFSARYRAATNNAGEYSSNNDAGDLYFNTDINALKVWTGSAWVAGVTQTGDYAVTTGDTFTGNLKLNDSVELRVGTGDDLKIYHTGADGNYSYITDSSGRVYLKSDRFYGQAADGVNQFYWEADSSTNLYFDGALKLETFADGVKVKDTGNNTSEIELTTAQGDGGSVYAYTADSPSGSLGFKTSAGEWAVRTLNNGSVELYHDAAKVLYTTTAGAIVKRPSGGETQFQITGCEGNDAELRLVADDGDDNNDYWRILADASDPDLWIQNYGSGNWETNINCTVDGKVALYYDNSKKLETTSSGVTLTGDVFFDNATNAGNDITWDMSDNLLEFTDDTGVSFGDGKDLQIYHNGSHSYITNSTGDLYLKTAASSAVSILDNNDDTLFRAVDDGAVELYYDNSKKLETDSNGVNITGQLDLTSNLSILDNSIITIGNGDDLKIYHNGSNSYLDNNTGHIYIRNNVNGDVGGNIYIGKSGEHGIAAIHDGAVELYYDNVKKFETTSAGVSFSGDTFMPDNESAHYGTGNDMYLYHDGSNSFITNVTGKLFLRSNTGVVLQDAGGNESFAEFNDNGAVELYYDGTKKFETYSGGTNIPDGAAYTAGDSNDVQLYHHSGASYLTNSTGSLYIRNGGGSTILIQPLDGEDAIKAYGNGRVELAYDHSKKLETTSSGITVTGSINASGLSKASGNMYINNNDTTNGVITFATNTNDRWKIDFSGNLLPAVNNDVNIGSSSYRVANLYVNDMHFANSPENTNSVDGTWGDWTLQEGEENIFMLNNRTGKKYKMALQEVV